MTNFDGGERHRQADREPDCRHDEHLAQHHPDQPSSARPRAPCAARSRWSAARRCRPSCRTVRRTRSRPRAARTPCRASRTSAPARSSGRSTASCVLIFVTGMRESACRTTLPRRRDQRLRVARGAQLEGEPLQSTADRACTAGKPPPEFRPSESGSARSSRRRRSRIRVCIGRAPLEEPLADRALRRARTLRRRLH